MDIFLTRVFCSTKCKIMESSRNCITCLALQMNTQRRIDCVLKSPLFTSFFLPTISRKQSQNFCLSHLGLCKTTAYIQMNSFIQMPRSKSVNQQCDKETKTASETKGTLRTKRKMKRKTAHVALKWSNNSKLFLQQQSQQQSRKHNGGKVERQ